MSYEYLRLLTNPRLVVVGVPSEPYCGEDGYEDLDDLLFGLYTYYKTKEELVQDLEKCGVHTYEMLGIAEFLSQLHDNEYYIGEGRVHFVELGQDYEN